MAEYTSTIDDLELADIFVDSDNDGIFESLVLDTGATIPVASVNPFELSKSVASGSIKRAVAKGWLTVGTTAASTCMTLSNGVVVLATNAKVMFINGSLSATVTLV